MGTRNSSGFSLDVLDLTAQLKEHLNYIRNLKNKSYTIEDAMKKCGLTKGTYFAICRRARISKTSIKKFSKLKKENGNIVVKCL